jgi:PIN domain nuclease of toxin-antitoxin system
MRLLLDTHAFLWFFIGNSALSAKARVLIEDDSNDKFFSIASLWEIATKASTGKLTLRKPFDEVFSDELTNNGIDLLGVTTAHISIITVLPFHHRDPFDRLLIAQAVTEQMQIVSADATFDDYSVKRLW